MLIVYTDESCDTSEVIAIYVAMTQQLEEEEGSVDWNLFSHLPVCRAKQVKRGFGDKFPYFEKVQITLDIGDGTVWYGSTYHNIHGNWSGAKVARCNLFYVLDIPAMMHPDYESSVKELWKAPESNTTKEYYMDGFNWCKTIEEFDEWVQKQPKISITEIQQQIKHSELIRWYC